MPHVDRAERGYSDVCAWFPRYEVELCGADVVDIFYRLLEHYDYQTAIPFLSLASGKGWSQQGGSNRRNDVHTRSKMPKVYTLTGSGLEHQARATKPAAAFRSCN